MSIEAILTMDLGCNARLSSAKYAVLLGLLSRQDGMTQTAMAAELELTKVAVGGLLARLERAGFVERRSDRADYRVRRGRVQMGVMIGASAVASLSAGALFRKQGNRGA